MRKIEPTKKYQRNLKKIVRRNKQFLFLHADVINRLQNDPFDYGLRTHLIQHPEHGVCWSSRITGDIRMLWQFRSNKLILILLDIGTHQDVY